MDWLTLKQVEQAAKGTMLDAMKNSLLHHEQGRDADKSELMAVIRTDVLDPRCSPNCACCVKYTYPDRKQCPFSGCGCGSNCCEDNWNAVDLSFTALLADFSNTNLKAFRTAEDDLCVYIAGKIAEVEAAELAAKMVEETYSIGDRFVIGEHRVGSGRKLLLSETQPYKYVHLIVLESGVSFGNLVEVHDNHRITDSEMTEIAGIPNPIIRYWDNAKKQLVGPMAGSKKK